MKFLKETSEAVSYAEVIRYALRSHEKLVAAREAGRRVFMEDEHGELVEVILLY